MRFKLNAVFNAALEVTTFTINWIWLANGGHFYPSSLSFLHQLDVSRQTQSSQVLLRRWPVISNRKSELQSLFSGKWFQANFEIVTLFGLILHGFVCWIKHRSFFLCSTVKRKQKSWLVISVILLEKIKRHFNLITNSLRAISTNVCQSQQCVKNASKAIYSNALAIYRIFFKTVCWFNTFLTSVGWNGSYSLNLGVNFSKVA